MRTDHPTAMDWSQRFALDEQSVIFRAGDERRTPRVTIGMPTYRRGHTIRRAAQSIAAQSYRDFVLVISDNNGEDPVTQEVVREMAADFPQVVLIAQTENIGAMRNLHLLAGLAETEYFMWLADDDEISPNYLEELVGLLEADPRMVSAQGRWRKMLDETRFEEPELVETGTGARAQRLAKHIVQGRNDSGFYGIHRLAALRKTHFEGYWWPNRTMMTNWCYSFLFDFLMQGPVGYSRAAVWTSHNYTEKLYDQAKALTAKDRAKTLARRVNLHWLYLRKTAIKQPMLLPVVGPAAMVALGNDVVSAVWRFASRAVSRRGK